MYKRFVGVTAFIRVRELPVPEWILFPVLAELPALGELPASVKLPVL